ncbi:MAG: MurT ligase domain-containing protein [Salinibacterium sp.]|nr:MurT ligase domain-containing protein [Salinibacterium sp.]
MRVAFAIFVGRVVQVLARLRGGKGSGAPGLVTNRLAPGLLKRVLASFPDGLVVVSGTSGKSTTTKMLAALLSAHGVRVFTNSSTANLPQGLMSAVLDQGDWRGRVAADIAVLEMDEAHGAAIAEQFSARVVVLTNVMLDDIERYQSMSRVASLLATIAARATEVVVVNADDAALLWLGRSLDIRDDLAVGWFGVTEAVLAAQRHGLGYASTAPERMNSADAVIVEAVAGRTARLSLSGETVEIGLPSRGAHFAVDAAAAVEASRRILRERFDLDLAGTTLSSIAPVFGRGEMVTINGVELEFVLVQNTASFQLNLDCLEPGSDRIFVAIGSEENDSSWLWTVDTSSLSAVDFVSGPKAEDMAIRLLYDGVSVGTVDRDLIASFDAFLALPTSPGERKTVLFTASCMRELRRRYGLVHAELAAAKS